MIGAPEKFGYYYIIIIIAIIIIINLVCSIWRTTFLTRISLHIMLPKSIGGTCSTIIFK